MCILPRAVETPSTRLHLHLDFLRLVHFFRFVRLLPRFRSDFLPTLIVRCFQRGLDGLGLHRLDRFERRYSFARHGLQPLAQRVTVVGHKLRPVPGTADFHVQCLLCRQVGSHDISRNLIRVWIAKYEAGEFDEEAEAADLLQQYEARIAALERLAGRQALEIEFIKGARKNAAPVKNVRTFVISGPSACRSPEEMS